MIKPRVSKKKWNLIHNLGVRKKSHKAESHNATFGEELSLNALNEYFVRLKPLPNELMNLSQVESKFKFKAVTKGAHFF